MNAVLLVETYLVIEHGSLAVSWGPGRFREPGEASENHVHLSWYTWVDE